MGRIHKKYYSANATFLPDEAIQEIKGSIGVVPDAINTMAKKYHISHSRVIDYIENREREQQVNSRLQIKSNKESIEKKYESIIVPSEVISTEGIISRFEKEMKRKEKNLADSRQLLSTS